MNENRKDKQPFNEAEQRIVEDFFRERDLERTTTTAETNMIIQKMAEVSGLARSFSSVSGFVRRYKIKLLKYKAAGQGVDETVNSLSGLLAIIVNVCLGSFFENMKSAAQRLYQSGVKNFAKQCRAEAAKILNPLFEKIKKLGKRNSELVNENRELKEKCKEKDELLRELAGVRQAVENFQDKFPKR